MRINKNNDIIYTLALTLLRIQNNIKKKHQEQNDIVSAHLLLGKSSLMFVCGKMEIE